jgi:hypothetical protein
MSGKIYVFDVLYNLRNSARFQPPKCLKSHFRDSRFQNFPEGACPRAPLYGLAPSAFASSPPKMKVWLRHCFGCCSTFGRRKEALACDLYFLRFPKVSQHPAFMDDATLHGFKGLFSSRFKGLFTPKTGFHLGWTKL